MPKGQRRACQLRSRAEIEFRRSRVTNIGSEFVTTSISSGGDGQDAPANAAVLLAENPHIKFVNTQRGYIVCDVTRSRWRSEYKVVPYVTVPGAPISTRASFMVQSGEGGL